MRLIILYEIEKVLTMNITKVTKYNSEYLKYYLRLIRIKMKD